MLQSVRLSPEPANLASHREPTVQSPWVRSLAILLALMVLGWSAHVLAYGGDALAERCQTVAGHVEDDGHHEHEQDTSAQRCCCDYIACTSAAIVGPVITVGTAAYSAVRYHAPGAPYHAVRAPYFDPDPPRPAALS